MEFLETGKIVNIHGLRGEVKVMPWSDTPDFICEFDTLYVGRDKTPMDVEGARVHKNMVLVKFEGISTPEEANKLRNSVVCIDREDVELPEGTYFIADLIGLDVIDADTDKLYGTVSDVFNTGANDIYEVKDGEKKYYIPAIPQVIIDTDLENKRITVRPPEGLIE